MHKMPIADVGKLGA